MQGWVKLFREILDDPVKCKDTEYFAVWAYLQLMATHTKYETIFGGKRVTLKPGQLITGRKEIARQWGMSDSKVQRILARLESEQLIEQQTSNKNRLITILEWEIMQGSEHQNEQQLNNNIPLEKEKKPTKETEKKPTEAPLDHQAIIDAWNELGVGQIKKLGSKRLASTKARIREFSLEEFFKAMSLIKESNFLQGENENAWVITYDWFIGPNNFIKVIEGKYTNRETHKLNPATTSGMPSKIDKFNTMLKHNFDYEEIERLEQLYVEQKARMLQEEKEKGVN